MLLPRVTVAGPVLTTLRSRTGTGVTLVGTVEVSSPGVPSVGTVAVLVTVPSWVVLTTKVIGPADAPTARVPTLQVTVLRSAPSTHGLPTLTKVVPVGRTSVMVEFGWATLPVLVMVSP